MLQLVHFIPAWASDLLRLRAVCRCVKFWLGGLVDYPAEKKTKTGGCTLLPPSFSLHRTHIMIRYNQAVLDWAGGVENKRVRIKARGKMSSSWEFCISLTVGCGAAARGSGHTRYTTHSDSKVELQTNIRDF